MYKSIYFFFLVILSFNAFSKIQQVDVLKRRLSFWQPVKWKHQTKVLGIPLVILGPMKQVSRPTISISPTKLTDVKFNPVELKNTQKKYYEGRINWLKKYKGKFLKGIPYQKLTGDQILNIHKIGFTYMLNDMKFQEMSFYTICNDELYHFKSLYNEEEHAGTDKIILKIVKSFSCSQTKKHKI